MQEAESEVIDQGIESEEDVIEGAGPATPGADEAPADDSTAAADAPAEVTITIGDAAADDEEETRTAPDWVRDLRKASREKDRHIRELEQKISTLAPAAPAIVVGAEPTIEGCDYDNERFSREFKAWHGRQQAAETEARKKQEAADTEKKAWEARLANHGKLKSELRVKDYDDAQAAVEAALSVTQRGLIVHGAENSAQLEYALGKNPKTLRGMAAITDPVKFAFAVAKLETKLKVAPRKTAPIPERTVRGNASSTGAVDSQLDRLRAEADKTGDRSKVSAYLRQKQQA